ncbi:hypothetical protein F4776DRAFT_668095 [Hypoxylon sp. NC0597]|nr:hypothetical protein F4776DRAFT_668095 [Hypoxylon sp. NC0597]
MAILNSFKSAFMLIMGIKGAHRAAEVKFRVSYVTTKLGDVELMEMKIPWKYHYQYRLCRLSCMSQTIYLRIGVGHSGRHDCRWHNAHDEDIAWCRVLADYVVLPAHKVVEKLEGLGEFIATGLLDG